MHSGSTLLSFLLNAHSQVIGLGEIHKFHKRIAGPDRDIRNLQSHELWRRVDTHLRRTSGRTLTDIDIASPLTWQVPAARRSQYVREWLDANHTLFAGVAEVSRKRVLVDASHHAERLLALRDSNEFDISVINLVRDGRAVANSFRRKYGAYRTGIIVWGRTTIRIFRARRFFPPERWLRVRYEDLASKPEDTLRAICAFLSLPFEPQMLAFRDNPYWGLDGNRMRWSSGTEIRLDERWRTELTVGQRLAFAVVGGWLNRLNGY